MGMFLMATGAQQEGSTAAKLWQIRISPAELEVLNHVEAQHRATGAWPKREEITLPAGLTDLTLEERDGELALLMREPTGGINQYKFLRDGTLVTAPAVEKITSLLQSQRYTPSPPVIIPPSPTK